MSTRATAPLVTGPRVFLQVDGLAILAGAIAAYAIIGGRWWLFAALLLAPDLFMLGYLAGPRVGAVVYNAGHSKLIPVSLVLLGALAGVFTLTEIGVIWAAHLGMDALFGYGYKYSTTFKDTHFGRV